MNKYCITEQRKLKDCVTFFFVYTFLRFLYYNSCLFFLLYTFLRIIFFCLIIFNLKKINYFSLFRFYFLRFFKKLFL